MRLDPTDLLWLYPGEPVVMRNIGGRVTHLRPFWPEQCSVVCAEYLELNCAQRVSKLARIHFKPAAISSVKGDRGKGDVT